MTDRKLGSDPEGHPLWERQVELELHMVERGAARYRSKVTKAKDKEEMTALRPYRRVLEDMVEVMGAGLAHWLKATEKLKGKGAKGIAYGKLQGLDPYVVSLVAARTILDEVSLENIKLAWIAHQIGAGVEHEARMAAWFARDPGLFKKVQHDLGAQKATATHRRRVNITRFNKLMRRKLRWRDWTRDDKLHTGLKLLEVLERTTGHIHRVRDPSRTYPDGNTVKDAPWVVVASEELLDYLQASTAKDEERCPMYLPTLMPPKPWEGVRSGGYYTPLVRLPNLIRFKADNEQVRRTAADEYDSIDMPRVAQALTKVQNVAWRVNRKVLAVALEAWDRDMAIGKLTKREPLDLPPTPEGMRRPDLKGKERREAEEAWRKGNPKAFQAWKRKAAGVYGQNARRVSGGISVRTTLDIAEMFLHDEFYFPHMLDFRGRMYPIPAYLQPQGNDLARGLLTFAHGRPVGEWGHYWLAIHLANCWGNDKITYDERRDWVIQNWDLWARIYQNPLGNLEWTQVGDPWQTLAAIFEFVRIGISDHPEREVSALPIRVDGTCNGIQHLSALMRDPVGAASVNLLPSETPRDIYGEVAGILQKRLEGIRDAGGPEGAWADKWLKAFGEKGIPRAFTKKPVMVTPYGGTRDSYKGSVMDWLKEANPTAIPDKAIWVDAPDKDNPGCTKRVKRNMRFEATIWIVPHLWDAVAEKVVQGRVCMEWLRDCARLVADAGQPIWWRTSAGFHVRHFYGKLKRRRVLTKIDGKAVWIVDYMRTKELSTKDQLQGIAPNFVHSQDAAVNMETILEFVSGDDPPPFTTIHDAFGTVAGEMWRLFGCIREAFVKIHSADALAHYRDQCVWMLSDYLMATKKQWDRSQCLEEALGVVPEIPERGALDIGEVRNADYFFA